MAEAPAPRAVSLAEARGWVGDPVDEIGGGRAGRVDGVFGDAESGEATWLVVGRGRLRGGPVAVPIEVCAAGGGRVWMALEGTSLRAAPVVDPGRPLLREHELTICAHFGIGAEVGRAAAVARRPEGSVTSQPAP